MKIMMRVGRVVEGHAVAILMVVLVLSAFAAWGVSRITVVTDQQTFLSPTSEAFRGYRAYENAFGGDSLLILIPGSPLELATSQALQSFTELDAKLKSNPSIRSVVSPLTLLEPAVAQGLIDLNNPASALQAALADPSLQTQLGRFFRNNHALVVVRLAGGLTADEQSKAAKFVQEAVASSSYSQSSTGAPDAFTREPFSMCPASALSTLPAPLILLGRLRQSTM